VGDAESGNGEEWQRIDKHRPTWSFPPPQRHLESSWPVRTVWKWVRSAVNLGILMSWHR